MRSLVATRAAASIVVMASISTCVHAADRPPASAKAGVKSASASASGVAAAAPVEFQGTLESGKSYVGDFAWDGHALNIWRPVMDVKVPSDHAWTIVWANLDKFPALKTAATRAKPQRFRFAVTGTDISSGSPTLPWTTIYRCELASFEPAPPPPPMPLPGRK